MRTRSVVAVGLAGAALAVVLAASAAFFLRHAATMLLFAYPLDYGEGPLLAQISLLRAGTPIWRVYADPAQPPFVVVNYPPFYLLATWLLSVPLGSALLAGRLVSLLAALACVPALWLLALPRRAGQLPLLLTGMVALAWLALPIVREWAVLMRVDMLGVALGLWGVLLARRGADGNRAALAGAATLLLLSLFTKPSLIAAPGAVVVWLLLRDWRRGLWFGGLLGGAGVLLVALLQWASGGWFWLHAVEANANTWEAALAYGFWRDQALIHGPLMLAGVLAGALTVWRGWRTPGHAATLPVLYTAFGLLTALGVGKVGAYANYFLELYAGLIWLAARAVAEMQQRPDSAIPATPNRATGAAATRRLAGTQRALFFPILMLLLVTASLVRYYPAWSVTYLKPAGVIEGSNPPRFVFPGYSVWRDLRRERQLLAAFGRVDEALVQTVGRSGTTALFTDIPGVAAQAGVPYRIQAFEHRQLLDQGLWSQDRLLVELANGQQPLIVLDFLGNWLSPEMITLITSRYAQTGSLGTYDLYKPVVAGPLVPRPATFGGLRLQGVRRGPLFGTATWEPGQTVPLTLVWQRTGAVPDLPDITVELRAVDGATVLSQPRPLLGGALPPERWPVAIDLDDMQPLTLPAGLSPGQYELGIRVDGVFASLGDITVGVANGRTIGKWYVPGVLLQGWSDLIDGVAISPAVPFDDGVQQCFERGCLCWQGGTVAQVPLGELMRLADPGSTYDTGPEGPRELSGPFAAFVAANGGEAVFGPPVTGELRRGNRVVQYTRFARLERVDGSDDVRLGPLGGEYLRLPQGGYRWR